MAEGGVRRAVRAPCEVCELGASLKQWGGRGEMGGGVRWGMAGISLTLSRHTSYSSHSVFVLLCCPVGVRCVLRCTSRWTGLTRQSSKSRYGGGGFYSTSLHSDLWQGLRQGLLSRLLISAAIMCCC